MSTSELSTVVSSEQRRGTIVNLKHVNELPLRNALETFDKNGDGKIDISELQKIVYWYGLWKYASIGLCMVVFTLIWSTFGLTIWAIDLTKDYTVTNGVLTGGDEVVKMSVASTYIPLSWATLLDRRHLDALESLSINVAQSSGKFSAGIYHMKVASYLHANSTYLKVFGQDGSRVWINSGTVVLHHPSADEAVMVCGGTACNTLAVDVKPEYLQQLVQRSVSLFKSSVDFELPSSVDGVSINKAEGQGATCQAWWLKGIVKGEKEGNWLSLDEGDAAFNDDDLVPEVWNENVLTQLDGSWIELVLAKNEPQQVHGSLEVAVKAQDAAADTSLNPQDNNNYVMKDEMKGFAAELTDGTPDYMIKINEAQDALFGVQSAKELTPAKIITLGETAKFRLDDSFKRSKEESRAMAQKAGQLAESAASKSLTANDGNWF